MSGFIDSLYIALQCTGVTGVTMPCTMLGWCPEALLEWGAEGAFALHPWEFGDFKKVEIDNLCNTISPPGLKIPTRPLVSGNEVDRD